MDALSEANGTFALTLLKKLGEDNSRNVFFSPLSISSALAMVLMGARGNTAAQMSQVRSGSRFWLVAYGVSFTGEPVSTIRIPEALLDRQASLPICPVPGPAGQCLSGWWPGAPDCAAPDSSRTGLNEQAFMEPLLGPVAQGPVGQGPSCREAQSQPRAGCTGCGGQLLGHSGGGALTSVHVGVTALPHGGARTPPRAWGPEGLQV